jgi:hypothetical protein
MLPPCRISLRRDQSVHSFPEIKKRKSHNFQTFKVLESGKEAKEKEKYQGFLKAIKNVT